MDFKRMPRGLKIGLVLLGIFIFIKMLFSCSHSKDSLQIIRSAKVVKDNLTVKVTATGDVKPYNRVEIRPPIAGRVEEVLVNEGDAIHKGQLLAWMSSTERATLLDAASMQGDVIYKHWEEAFKPVPLMSPLDGTLIVRSVEPGQTVEPTNPVVVISDRLIVAALVDETDLSFIKLNQKTEIRLDAYPDKVIPGKVGHIYYESKLVNNVNVYEVDVIPDETLDIFRSGMTANVTFIVTELKDVLLVPSEAITEWPRGISKPTGIDFAVYVKSFGGKLKPLPVRIGQSDGRTTEITEGLKEGTVVEIVRRKQAQSTTPFSAFGQKQNTKPSK